MSTRKGQAASVTLLRREQLRSASAPTYSIVGFPTSIRRKSRARLWSMESPENHPKGSLVVSFLFLLEPKGDPAQRSAFGKEEGGCEYGAFAAPAEAEWSRLLLTLRRFFSFSEKRKKRMGAQKRGRAMPAPTASILVRWKIESQQSLRHGCAVPPPFTQGRLLVGAGENYCWSSSSGGCWDFSERTKATIRQKITSRSAKKTVSE